ncbi:hypothetical protein Bca4012_015808 [Brassica carinata]
MRVVKDRFVASTKTPLGQVMTCSSPCNGTREPLGTPALPSRGFVEEDFAKVAEYVRQSCEVGSQSQI